MSRPFPRPLTLTAMAGALILTGCAQAQQQQHPHRPQPQPAALQAEPLAAQPVEACGALFWGALPSQFPGVNGGSRIDQEDCQKGWIARQSALGQATPTREPIYWANEKTGNYGSFTPTTDIPLKGPVCRQYEQMLVIDGGAFKTIVWACLQHDGSWKIAGSLG